MIERQLVAFNCVPAGSDGLFMVVDEQSTFREDNFQKAIASMTETAVDGKGTGGSKAGGQAKKENRGGEGSDIFKIVKMIMERNYDPGAGVGAAGWCCLLLYLAFYQLGLEHSDVTK